MKRKEKIKKLSLEDFCRYMVNRLENNQILLHGYRVNLIGKMFYEWGIESYEDLAIFPFSKLLMNHTTDIEFLGNLELQMNLHGMTLNMDVENIPLIKQKKGCWVNKLNRFYEWMEEHEDLISWSDLPESPEEGKSENIRYYESERDYLKDIFRGLIKEIGEN